MRARIWAAAAAGPAPLRMLVLRSQLMELGKMYSFSSWNMRGSCAIETVVSSYCQTYCTLPLFALRSAPKHSHPLRRQRQRQPFTYVAASDDESLETGTVASLTVAIEKALRERKTDDAIRVFENLRKKGSFPSRDCISTLVAQLAYKQTPITLSQADKLVHQIMSLGRKDLLDQNSLSLLALAYAGVGMSTFSRATLKLMFQTGFYPSVRVWTAVVSKIAENTDEAPAALELFNEICKLTGSLVQSANSVKREEREANRTAADADPVARIIRLMDHAMALKGDNDLLVHMKPDLMAFNTALRICANLGLIGKAEEIFENMAAYGICPDSSSFDILVRVYGKAGQFHMFRTIPERMEAAAVKPTGSTLKALTDAYVESGSVNEAEKLLQRTIMGQNSMWSLAKVDADIYNNLLKAYASEKRLDDAANLLVSLPADDPGTGISQGKVVWSMVASGLMTEIYSIIQHMTFRRMPLSIQAYRSLMQGFCSNNQLDKAAGIILLMKRKGVKPDSACYGPLIQGLIRCGDKLLAFHTFEEMVEARVAPEEIVYISLLKALAVEEKASKMLQLLEGLLEFRNIKVGLFAWNLVIEHTSRRGMIGDAKRLLARMDSSGVLPDSFTFWYIVKGLITRNRLVEVLSLWPQIAKAIRGDRPGRIQLHKELVDSLLYAFVKGAYFRHALDLLVYVNEEGIPIDKDAFKELFLKYHSHRFTSKHKSPLRVYRRQQQVDEMEEFKKWLKLAPIKIPSRYSKILKSSNMDHPVPTIGRRSGGRY